MSTEDAIRLVPASATDVDEVADLWITLARGQRNYGSDLLTAANRTAVRESFARAVVTGELLVARDDDGIVGFVSFSLDHGGYERDRPRGTVTNLFVIPERRGEGIGSRLLEAAERGLVSAGAAVIGLEAMAENDRARTFYREHGYDVHRVTLTKPIDDDAEGGKRGDGNGPDVDERATDGADANAD